MEPGKTYPMQREPDGGLPPVLQEFLRNPLNRCYAEPMRLMYEFSEACRRAEIPMVACIQIASGMPFIRVTVPGEQQHFTRAELVLTQNARVMVPSGTLL